MTSSSETEAMLSDDYNNDDLSSLFQQLSEKTKQKEQELTSQYDILQKTLNKLPKIDSNLEKQLEKSKPKTNILRINDPITSVAPKNELKTDSGAAWFNMRQPELTEGTKRDLLIIKQRSALDPKRHYKKQKWDIPKFFQMGTIIEGNTEFYSRLNRKQRGNNLVLEILLDDDSKKYFKRKYGEIQVSKTSGRRGYQNKMKDMRKKY